jgi:hypothetical protein
MGYYLSSVSEQVSTQYAGKHKYITAGFSYSIPLKKYLFDG